MEIFAVKDLNFCYVGGHKNAIDGLSVDINQGDFVVVAGASGSGKSTFLKLLKPQLCPSGQQSGSIDFFGKPLNSYSSKQTSAEIGFVAQNPESQIVTDKVWRELAFGLENLGTESNVILKRIGEMASYFGLAQWFRKDTSELSGGQKQLLNLASVMVMQPKILLLDEPTAQLDPIAATEFIDVLQRVNKELGITVVVVEHRLEQLFAIADKALIINEGKVVVFDTPNSIGSQLSNDLQKTPIGLPCVVRIFSALGGMGSCPLSLQQGKEFLRKNFGNEIRSLIKEDKKTNKINCTDKQEETKITNITNEKNQYNINKKDTKEKKESKRAKVIEIKDGWFRYDKDGMDILRGVNLKLYEGEIFCLVGGNGTGKSTLLKVLSRQKRIYQGKIEILGKAINDYKGESLYRHSIAYLPQNPQEVFLKDNVYADFEEMCKVLQYENAKEYIEVCLDKLGVSELANRNPFDVSGGQQQKLAIAKILLLQPKIILLDEPTKGIDSGAKIELVKILKKLSEMNISIIIVSHDIEFCAEVADRCAMMFDGQVIAESLVKEFFEGNSFYTTTANKLSRGYYDNCITAEDVIEIAKLNKKL